MWKKVFIWLILVSFLMTACVIPSFLLPADISSDSTNLNETFIVPTRSNSSSSKRVIPSEEEPVETQVEIHLTATPQKSARLIPGKATVQTAVLKIRYGSSDIYSVDVSGTLPSDCNIMAADVARPDKSGRIVVTISSVVDPSKMCSQKEIPFTANFIFDKLEPGNYTIKVNNVDAGSFGVSK
jgi:hypothetical protein